MKSQADVEELNKKTVIRLHEDIDKKNFDAVIELFPPYTQIDTFVGLIGRDRKT